MAEENDFVLYCPHCGNTSVQTRLLAQPHREQSYWGPEAEVEFHDAVYTVTRCATCSRLLVYDDCEDFTEQTALGDLVFPKQAALSRAVPDNVRRVYQEAQRVKQTSPIAFAVLSRRVLEEICRAKGIDRPNLSAALAELAKQGVIPSVLSDASSLIRLIGNAGAHASDLKITVPHVWAIDSFVMATIEYLFLAPARLEQFKQSLSKSGESEG